MDSQIAFYIAQGISVITGVLAIILMQLKSMKTILLFQIIVNLLASVNYFLLGGSSGALISVLAIIQASVMFLYNRKSARPHMAVIIAFTCAYVACSAYNIVVSKSVMELLPAFAAICYSMSLIQRTPAGFRIFGALNPSFWLVYDIYTKSYVMFCVHLGILISSIVAMIRIDGIFRSKNKKGA